MAAVFSAFGIGFSDLGQRYEGPLPAVDDATICAVADRLLALGAARGNYKEGTLVYNRDPTEIHRPLIDPGRYEFTFAPDPAWCRILEYYCPGCGTQIEAEYLPPGHPPTYDMQIDVDALKAQWAARPPGTVIPLGRDVTAEPLRVSGSDQ